jgi:polysaccharide biosynthesis/export protein VpsN
MMRALVLLPALIAVLLADSMAAAQSLDQQSQSSVVPADELGPGDAIRITVWRKPELSGEYLITSDGVIADPFYMEVPVTGLPLPSVIEGIRSHVARFENAPRVLVEPLYRIAISGEVRQPNLYSLAPATTVEQAVLLAGGMTDRARTNRVLLVRGDQRIEVDLTRHGEGLAGTPIRSADQIVVPRRASILRDYVVPASSIVAASFSIINVWLRAR